MARNAVFQCSIRRLAETVERAGDGRAARLAAAGMTALSNAAPCWRLDNCMPRRIFRRTV